MAKGKSSGINRSIDLPRPSVFGRIGTGLGQGLAQQLPQEIERGRLASGLKSLSDQQGLTPFQQFSALASIPGITPQMIQSGAELLKQQGIRNAYKRGGASGQEFQEQNPQVSPNLQSVQFGQLPGQMQRNMQSGQQESEQIIPSNQPREQEALSNPPAANENPLNESLFLHHLGIRQDKNRR